MKKFSQTIVDLSNNWSYAHILILIALSVVILLAGLSLANEHYALSRYPSSLFEGQLAFSPEKVKDWNQVLIDRNTLDIYVTTHYLDFIFIAGLMATIFFTQLLIVKLNPATGGWHRFAVGMCFWGPLLATADIWENLLTLTMLNNPVGFSD